MTNIRMWLAWTLVRLAEKLYSSEYDETLIIERHSPYKTEEVLRVEILGDTYGSGVRAIFNGLPDPEFELRWISDGDEQEIYAGGTHRD